MAIFTAVPAKLLEYRTRKDLALRPTKHLKETFTDFDGQEKPLSLRYYQVQGVLHLVAMPRFLLGDDTGLGKCCTYDTLLSTDRGLLRLGDLAPQGEGPLTPDTFYPLTTPREVWTGWNGTPVKQFYCGGVKPTLRVQTRRGYEMEGTLVHPLWMRGLAGESFTPLKDIQVGDVLCLDRTEGLFPAEEPELPQPTSVASNTRLYQIPRKLTPDLAALLGYIVAEGYTAQRNTIQVTQHRSLNPEAHDQIRALFHEVFGWEGNQEAQNRNEEIIVNSTHIRLFLEGLGVGYGLAATKCVPWPILQGTQASMTAFLRAFWDSEGSITGGVSEVSSASEVLLREIQILLLRFGILSSRSPKKVADRPETYWRLTFCGEDAQKFAQQIGCLTPRKQKALEVIACKRRNANLDVVPYARDAVEALRAEILKSCSRIGANDIRRGAGLKQFGISFEKTLNNIRNGGRNPTYTFLGKLLNNAVGAGVAVDHPAYQEVLNLYANHWFYDPVVSITAGEAPVADIEVEDARHCFVGNGFVNHNTLEAIAALCFIWEKAPDQKVLVLTTKSASKQWAKEFGKFTRGVRVFLCTGSKEQREAVQRAWRKSTGPTVMIMGYAAARRDFTQLQEDAGYIAIFDEATAFKNTKTQVWQACHHFSHQASRCWGLTATLIKNHLMEGHGIYSVVVPGLFGTTNNFMYYFCIIEMMMVGRGRKVPRIVGYYPEKVAEFREKIAPYFLGRPKHDVASELPTLIRQVIEVGMTDYQSSKYREALSNLLVINEGKEDEEEKETTKLTAIGYCQEIVDHLELIGCEGTSEKLDSLLEMLTDGDLAGEKVIIFSRFKKMINILMPALKNAGIKAVRVTGDEDGDERQAAMDSFQDPNSDTTAVCITMAGSDAINLQAAKAIVFYDSPWSAGDYIQCLDEETEILTPNGFKQRGEIQIGDSVAAFDPASSEITWSPVRSVVERPLAEGEQMFAVQSRHMDVRVTAGHRMLFKRKNYHNKKSTWPVEWRFQAAGQMASERSHYCIPACGVQEAPGLPLTDDQLEFIGWYLSDGCINKSNAQLVITQAVHQPQIEDLRRCIQDCGFDWSEYGRDPDECGGFPNGKPQIAFSIPKGTGGGTRSRSGWGVLAEYLDKDFSPSLEGLTAAQLDPLLRGLHLGDGSKYRGDAWSQQSYHVYTSNPVFADRVQSLCVRRGYRCNLSVRPADPSKNRRVRYTLHIKRGGSWSLCGWEGDLRPKFKSVQVGPRESVWCVENDVGTLVTRRNGKVAVVGNCLGRMIRIGSKHTTVHAMHLVSQWDSGETVDQRIMEVLGKKMTLVEAVIGERIKGMSSNGDGPTIEVRSEINEIFAALKSDAALLKEKA